MGRVRTKRGRGHGRPGRPGEAETTAPGRGGWLETGTSTKGPHGHPQGPGASCRSWELLFPGGPHAGPAAATAGPLFGPAGPNPEPENRTSSENCPDFRAHRAHAWGQPECCEAWPGRVRRRRSGLNGVVVGQGSQGEQARLPFPPRAGCRRGRGRREQQALIPLRAALAASLQPGLGQGCGSRARPAAPPLSPPPARLSGRSPGPRGLAADGGDAGVWRAHGWPRGAAAGGGAGGGSTRPAAGIRRRGPGGGGLGARSPALSRSRSERESKTGTGQSRRGSSVPAGPHGERVWKGPSGAEGAGGGGGGGSEGGPVGTLLPEAPALGRPAWAAGIMKERPPPRGAPVGNKLHDHSSKPRKTSPFCSPSGCGRPAVASPASRPCSRWAPARAPSSAPSPARGLPPLRPAGGRQRRCSSAHYFKSPEYDLTRTESHSEREGESERGGKSCSPLSSTFR